MAGAFFGFGCEHYIEDEHLHHRHKHIVLLTLRSLATFVLVPASFPSLT